MKVAIVGNPNSGKTTLFNVLTNMNCKIGNWPGVTIEKKVGIIKNKNHVLIDLPGIYSLSPYSIEEEISRKYIFEEKPDCILNIIDSTSLERSLYLTTQLLELDINVIIVLNMSDILEKKGISINLKKLEYLLGTRVIKISAMKESGIDELIKEIDSNRIRVSKQIYNYDIEKTIMNIQSSLSKELENKRFISVKLIEEDNRFIKLSNNKINQYISNLKQMYNDLDEEIASQRYNYIEYIKEETFSKNIKNFPINDILDKLFLNKYLAFPIFILVMTIIYYLSVGVVGNYTIEIINNIINVIKIFVSNFLSSVNSSNILISLVVDGVIVGIGSVLTFIPQLIILFSLIYILESSGYMARVAFLLDRLFKKIGLNGKSLLSFIVGLGCSVPGIMSTKIIENRKERELTAILTPFIPCSAKLPMIVLFSSYFFKNNFGIISVSFYFLSVLLIIIISTILNKYYFKNDNDIYILELPEYKIPSFKLLIRDVFDKVLSFIRRAGSIIMICSIIIWFLLSFSFKLEYGIDIEYSILACIGKKISWIFYPFLGFKSWACVVSSIFGLIAKEQVISSMSIISGITSNTLFENSLFMFNKSSAYAFLVFNLFSAPCFSTISTLKKEIGYKVIFVILFQILFAWLLSVFIYQIINNTLNTTIVIIIIILIIISLKIYNKNKCSYCNNCGKCNNK